ncbi:cytochrome P450 monooxygenase [Fusarium denticulatum]|uniref:Cytochrome P450 monooxygenase n=1 Tax=Fusarium denticulatum TaxID=48507 RepID=A0A8H6CWH8_9HYPO|nr:cytochrome P450 monooxygenase [Fusarium denticulatum]
MTMNQLSVNWEHVASTWQTASSTSRVIIAISTLSLTALLISIIYELYFSPLSKFPGPKLCAISRIPHLIATASGRQLPWLINLHNKYGGVVRIAPDALTFTDERAWADICGASKAAKDGMAKDPRLAALVGGDLVNPDPAKPRSQQTHSIMRKAMVPALKRDNVKKLEGMINGHIEEYLSALKDASEKKEAVDMRDMNSFLICDLIADLFLGESLHLFTDPEFIPWVHSFDRFARGVTVLAVLNRFPFLHKFLLFAVHRWGSGERDSFMAPIFARFDRRVALTSTRHDMLQMVLDGDTEGTGRQGTMPLDLLREFAPFLMLGGCEAMPTVLTGFVYFVFRKKSADIRRKLLEEVRGAFSSNADITMDKISQSQKNLPYLEACLQESIRCYSPAATGTDRVVPPSGAQIADRFVPGNTVVMMLHQVTYSVKHNFSRAADYVPERWLPEGKGRPQDCIDDVRGSVHPFSVGPQSCFGQELSFYVLRLALCKLLYRFDIELTPESENWVEGQLTFGTRSKPPLMAYVKKASL